MKKLIRALAGLTAIGTLLFASYKLTDYYQETQESSDFAESLADEAVTRKETHPALLATEPSEDQEPTETAPIEVDFDVLLEKNRDVIGWLYCEDTPINLPVVQSSDNDYYLRRLLDGTWNSAGTLFADYRNTGDFSDENTIIYGHNMKNSSMFGSLTKYKTQSYYDEHPVLWLLTPETDYKVELIAGYVTPVDSEIYFLPQTEQEVQALIEQAIQKSTFTADVELTDTDRYLTLSTCSYEYDNARYVLIGRLIPLN